MVYKVGILGATGRVGLEIAGLLQSGFSTRGDYLELSDAVANSKKMTSVEGVPVRLLHEPELEPVHVWIDFSQPQATLGLLEKIQTPIVIGTTGFSQGESARIQEYSKKYPVLLSSNMSPGMNLVLSLLQSVPIPPSLGFDVAVEETHHVKKKDAPSGTALSIIKTLEETGQENIQVNSIRAGSVKGVHKISFIGQDEEFSIEHRVFNRTVFARGALLAAHFLVKQKPGLYSMEDLWKNEEVES